MRLDRESVAAYKAVVKTPAPQRICQMSRGKDQPGAATASGFSLAESETGIQMEQAVLVTPPRLPEDKPPLGNRREVFALDEGDVVITFPDGLSADSFADLKSYLDVFVKKMQRRAGVP